MLGEQLSVDVSRVWVDHMEYEGQHICKRLTAASPSQELGVSSHLKPLFVILSILLDLLHSQAFLLLATDVKQLVEDVQVFLILLPHLFDFSRELVLVRPVA